MLFLALIILIVFGIALLVLELLVLPGLVAGIIGGIFILAGVLSTYAKFGDTYGHWTLLATFALTLLSIIYSLKSKAWSRFGLKNSLQGKVVEVDKLNIQEGDEGTTISALRPMGHAMFGENKVEVQTNGELVDSGAKVIVIKVITNKLIVKPKK